jgi:hypothetical protein
MEPQKETNPENNKETKIEEKAEKEEPKSKNNNELNEENKEINDENKEPNEENKENIEEKKERKKKPLSPSKQFFENEFRIKLLRKKRKSPNNNPKQEYIKNQQIIGIKYSVKDPDDINWKKKIYNYKNYPGYDILSTLAKQYPYETIISAILKNGKKNISNDKLRNILAGLINANGYANIISMLLQIKQRIDEKRKVKEEKDNISLSSGESIKPKMKVIGEEESSFSDESSEIDITNLAELQTDLVSNPIEGDGLEDDNLINDLNHLSMLNQMELKKKNRGRPRKN